MSDPVDPNARELNLIGQPPTELLPTPSHHAVAGDTPKGGSSRAILIAATAGVTFVVVTLVIAWFVLRPRNHELSGSLSLFDTDYMTSTKGASCDGEGGYSDIGSGGQVVVKDGRGATLAVGKLGQGKLLTLDEALGQAGGTTTTRRLASSSARSSPTVCQFTITVADVPEADFYRIEIGHRQPVEYSKAKLEAEGWRIDLVLGDP